MGDSLTELVDDALKSLRFNMLGQQCFLSDDRCSPVRHLVETDLTPFVRPFCYASRNRAARGERLWDRSEGEFLRAFLAYRANRVCSYLEQVVRVAVPLVTAKGECAKLSFLSGDSHRGGARPILAEGSFGRMVVKQADPRPYEILSHVVEIIESQLSIGLKYPPLVMDDPSCQWQVLPFLEGNACADSHEERLYMVRLGAVTAAAYLLDLTDVHLENLIVTNRIPVIVDPECMFSGFSARPRTPGERLVETGLVAPQEGLSAILGGDIAADEIGGHIFEGRFSYLRPVYTRAHRLMLDDGSYSDPRTHLELIARGFEWALRALEASRGLLTDILFDSKYRTCATRYVYRPTAHYKCYLELLFSPANVDRRQIEKALLADLFELKPFDDGVEVDVRAGEACDILTGDIPYFYLSGDEPCVRHELGEMSSPNSRFTLTRRLERAVEEFRADDFPVLVDTLRHFIRFGKVRA